MNEILVRNWNEVVGVDDIVYHLGDSVMGDRERNLSILCRLNGYIILLPGNHDKLFLMNARRNDWPGIYLSNGIQRIFYAHHFPQRAVRFEEFNLAHFPYVGDSHNAERYRPWRPLDDGRVLLHGHRHSKTPISYSPKGTLQYDVGVDANSFFPVSLDHIRSLVHR